MTIERDRSRRSKPAGHSVDSGLSLYRDLDDDNEKRHSALPRVRLH